MGANMKLTKEQALQKLKHYCTYQERSHYEVMQKLWELKVAKSDHDLIIATLIDEDYLNEERFAIQFAGGKFRMKQWGRVKIKLALKQKKVSEVLIKQALKGIDERDYNSMMKKIIAERGKKTAEKNPAKRKYKIAQYLISRGFEPELIWEILNERD